MSFLRVRSGDKPPSPRMEVVKRCTGRASDDSDDSDDGGNSLPSSKTQEPSTPGSPGADPDITMLLSATEPIHPPAPGSGFAKPRMLAGRRKSIHVPMWANNKPADLLLKTTTIHEDDVEVDNEPAAEGKMSDPSSQPSGDLSTSEFDFSSMILESTKLTSNTQNDLEMETVKESETFTDDAPISAASIYKRKRRGRKFAVDMSLEDRVAYRLTIAASQGHGMKSIRQWLQSRFSSAEILAAAEEGAAQKKERIITPKTIPDFVIPPKHLPLKRHLNRALSDQSSQCSFGIDSNNNEGDELSGCEKHYRKVSSVPSGISVMSNTRLSHEDPGYNAAVSMPHLITTTSYGFPTVLEHPNTRRKESLLIGSLSADKLQRLNEMSIRVRSQNDVLGFFDNISDSSSGVAIPCKCDGNSSPSTFSPGSAGSDVASAPPPGFEARKYRRRRSSLPSSNSVDLNLDEALPDSFIESGFDTRITEFQTKQEAQLAAPVGELKFSLIYVKSIQQLRLTVIKAENLMKQGKDIDCNSYIKIYLESAGSGRCPSRNQTEVIRGNKNPIYNRLIILKDITVEDLRHRSLRLRIINKVGSGVNIMSRQNTEIGEVVLRLRDLNLQLEEEVRMWRDLETPSDESTQSLGNLNLSLILNPKEEKLYVTVKNARNLTVTTLTGAQPDSYVKVCVTQASRPEIRKQTRIKKSSTSPEFNETFVFSISPKLEDLYQTSISLRMMSKERLRNDTVIGEAILGMNTGYDLTEVNHWNNLLSAPSKKMDLCLKIEPSSGRAG